VLTHTLNKLYTCESHADNIIFYLTHFYDFLILFVIKNSIILNNNDKNLNLFA